ncbi:MAG: M14 family metallopeptidase [Rhodospirillaceae bacterium]|nr:M14 family metallopeptidase [Rhodospirillaceae bacterium]
MEQPESWFAADYAEARAKFRAAAERTGAALAAYRNPDARQPDGGDLTTDVVRLGPAPDRAAKVLIVSSGTHGVEGFCGSSCQIGMLETGAFDLLPDGCALLLVHALNPYGFAWLRRVTEDNIDLNRNNLDHGAGHPANPAYAEIHAWLTPRDWHGPGRAEADAAIAAYIGEHGMFAFQEAVSGGQYDFPDGLFFGGRALSWSARTWRAIVEDHCRGAERVAHLDFHTGLGDYGACEIISVEGAGTARARLWYGDEVKSPERNDSLSAVVTGSVENAFDGIARETEVTSVALEYGTQTLPEVLEALRADNWLHLYGDPESDQGKAIKRQIRNAFYGDEPAWKRTIWETADRVVRQAAAGLAAGLGE